MKYLTALLLGSLLVGCDSGFTKARRASRLEHVAKKLAEAKSPEERFYALGDMAKESFIAGRTNDALNYAKELATMTPKYVRDWNYGNAIQDANLVFGRLAVLEGRLTDAKNFLILAGESPGSPQMDSFGPNMSLAKDLLERGEREVVLDYFKLCKKFWDPQFSKLDEWAKEVEAGRIPDFGANLVY